MIHQIWEYELTGNMYANVSQRPLCLGGIEQLRNITADHMAVNSDNLMSSSPEGNLSGYLYAWLDIAGIEIVQQWIVETSPDDKGWLDKLLCLRTRGVSTDRGAFLKLNTGDLRHFFVKRILMPDCAGLRKRVNIRNCLCTYASLLI